MFETKDLKGKTIAILATDGFEESELFKPKETLEAAGATTKIISLKGGSIKAWNKTDWGKKIDVDELVSEANSEDFDAILLPGGVMNPDKLRIDADAVQFVKEFILLGKPVAAICHGPWILIETGLIDDCTLTSWPSLKTDLINAGATWLDQEVIVDQGIITSRKPEDIPAFCRKFIEQIVEYSETPVTAENNKAKSDHHHARI
ncbi:MAG: type 1 glutamine amidotransferase [Bdellovibrio sp.]|nr:type 1 glutamine amidotransferase [Bdellovibrio sp.]